MTACPLCKTTIVRLAPRTGVAERLLGLLLVYPHRCQLCGFRFLTFRGVPAFVPRRNYHRVRVSFPTLLRSALYRNDVPEQHATLVDLSIGGCRLRGPLQVQEGTRFRVEFTTPHEEPPIVIDEAVVCSLHWNGAGLLFTKLRRQERGRIAKVIRDRLAERLAEARPIPQDTRL